TLVKLKKGTDKAVAIAKVKQLIKGTQLEVRTHKQIADTMDRFMAAPMLFPSLTFNIAVLVSLLGLINTIAIGVLERRREIGLIKAIGGTRGQVRLTITLEAVLTSLVGTIFGVLIGTGIAVILFKSISAINDIKPTFFSFPVIVTSFPVTTTAVLFVMVIIVSIIGALIPVRLANKVTPVEALRFE
ncbi:MAG TPA: FtsX-like permease family protein, partial [Anaerolineae bacterium]|nr:FtsX-like permease family protein [Anaerolineae bacterium]